MTFSKTVNQTAPRSEEPAPMATCPNCRSFLEIPGTICKNCNFNPMESKQAGSSALQVQIEVLNGYSLDGRFIKPGTILMCSEEYAQGLISMRLARILGGIGDNR